MLAGKHPFSQPWRNGVAASMKDFPGIPLKSQYVFSAQHKDHCRTPKSWQPKQREGYNPPHRERCVTATHMRGSGSIPTQKFYWGEREERARVKMWKSWVGRWGKGILKEEEKGIWQTAAALQAGPGECTGAAGHTPQLGLWHCCPSQLGWPGTATMGASHHRTGAERSCLVPLAPKVKSGDPGSVW